MERPKKQLIIDIAALIVAGLLLCLYFFLWYHPEVESTPALDQAEELMEAHPDSALSELNQINTESLKSHALKARYSLLKTQAVDRNYIDTTDLSILKPALDYYLRKGTPEQKIKTLYYQARIYQNRQEEDTAMFALLKARELIPASTDTLMNARVLAGIAAFQFNILEIKGSLKHYLEAAELFGKCKNPDNQVWNLSNALMECYILKDKETADTIRELAKPIFDSHPELYPTFYPSDLRYAYYFGTEEEKKATLMGPDAIDSISDDTKIYMANLYCEVGDPVNGRRFFEAIDPSSVVTARKEYLALKPFVYESDHDYKDALIYYKDVIQHFDSTYRHLISKNLLFTDKEYELEKKRLQEHVEHSKITLWLIVGCLGLALIGLFLFYWNWRKKVLLKLEKEKNERLISEANEKQLEADNLELRYNQLQLEAESLRDALNQRNELSEQVKTALRDRLEALNEFLTAKWDGSKSSKLKLANDILKRIDKFQDNTVLAFRGSHPGFIRHLEQLGLTEEEIRYACMYAVGFSGKEISSLLKINRIYHYNSALRTKLGLTSSKDQIGIHIRKLLKET